MTPTQITDTELTTIRTTGQSSTTAILADARSVTVTDAASYHSADAVLYRIRSARKQVEALIEEKVDSIIKPIRAGLDKLYAARRELLADLDAPLETAEKSVKKRMADWQAEQARIREAEERDRAAEADRLRREQAEMERRAQAARNAQERANAQAEAERLAAERQAVKEVPRTVPVKAAGSRVTVTRRPEVVDMTAFLKAIIAETIPEGLVMVNEEVMKAYWEADRGLVSAWPGVRVVQETKVGGR